MAFYVLIFLMIHLFGSMRTKMEDVLRKFWEKTNDKNEGLSQLQSL